MSTCPRCRGFLTDGHKCPRSRARTAAEIAVFGVAGGVVALLVVALFEPVSASSNMDAVAVMAGAAIAIIIRRLLNR